MYVIDGIAYAGEQEKEITVNGIRAMDDYKLWLRFSTGEAKVFDFAPLLKQEAFRPLTDLGTFRGVYIDYGIPVWNDGAIDIAPQYLYEHAVAAKDESA